MSSTSSDGSLRMLSPPLSPYPDLASFSGSYKVRAKPVNSTLQTCRSFNANNSPSTSRSASEEPEPESCSSSAGSDLVLATPCASESPASDCQASQPKRKLVSCWDSMVSNPSKFYKKERSYLELYPINKPVWSSYTYVENSQDAKSRRKPRALRARRTISESEDLTFGGDAAVLTRSRAASVQPSMCEEKSSDDEGSSAKTRTPARKRPSSTSPVKVHDMGIEHINDYSPDVKTLPAGRSLRAEWKGAPMDLSDDPDVHLLHPAEIHLASVLRLPAEVYLDSKRRLFAEKVHRLRQNLPFRRTDSQKACRIDVNKASRLFGAFEKVGWLEDHLFLKHL